MKKITSIVLLLIMALNITACKGNENSSESHSRRESRNQETESDNTEYEKQDSKTEPTNSEDEKPIIKKEYDVDLEKHLKVGDFIQFGTYEQDNSILNGPERIEWQVLDIQYGKILLMSRYALDCQPLNKDENEYAWDKCSVREWLNNDFYNEAFSDKEKDFIQLTKLTTKYKNNKLTTDDKIFLLSNNEVYHYLRTLTIDDEASSFCYPTKYSVEIGVKSSEETKNRCDWFLRDANAANDARFVNWKYGTTDYDAKVTREDKGIRPAMWLNYENISLNDAEVGDIVAFGNYRQDTTIINDEGLRAFVNEPILWEVLDIQDGKKLLITKVGLVAYTYGDYYDNQPVTWENSKLRKQLKNYFYDDAFSEEEQNMIQETTLSNPDNDIYGTDGGNDTIDKVFILSLPEVEKYFGGTRDKENYHRACFATEYLNGSGTNGAGNNCSWYTRTPGKDQRSVVFVDYYEISPAGLINMEGCDVGVQGISTSRPAIWVKP